MGPLNKILQNAPKTPQEKILNNSLEIEEDMCTKFDEKILNSYELLDKHCPK